MNEKYQNFLTAEFTVFDIETSGLDPRRDEILEIAAIKFKGKEEMGRFESLIQPTKAISPEVEKIHGLNEIYLLVNGRRSDEAIKNFLAFCARTIIVGHNIKEFDWLFILNHLKKNSLPSPANKFIDTLELSRRILSLPTYSLSNVAQNFGLEHRNAHRAMPDVEVNAQVFIQLMEKLLLTDNK
ncbi:MAG: 3'-5' exonuclease [Patescibacteria group bacterium]